VVCFGNLSLADIPIRNNQAASNRASARSPDLTPPDYLLWGYLKGRVYQNKPRTIYALKANLTEEIQAVTADILARNFQNMVRRVPTSSTRYDVVTFLTQ
jgi:hypothetical protein